MTTTKSSRQIASERRAALSSFGKGKSGQAFEDGSTAIISSTAPSNKSKQLMSARERRKLMSKTGQASLPMADRTRAMLIKDAPLEPEHKPVKMEVLKTLADDTFANVSKSEAQKRREQLSKYGKAGLSSVQSPAYASRSRAQSLRAKRKQFGKSSGEDDVFVTSADEAKNLDVAQTISGTPLEQHPLTTGVERGLCHEVTGTEYFSDEIFGKLCPPANMRRTSLNNEIRISGRVATSRLMRPETHYANDVTASGLLITGGETVRNRITGTDGDRSIRMSGSQYRNVQPRANANQRGRDKLMDSGRLTGHFLDGSRVLTGATQDKGSDVTGDNYADNRRTSRAQRAVVSKSLGLSRINSGARISGAPDGAIQITGTPDSVLQEMSGTPYVGSKASPPTLSAHSVTGTQPAIGSGVTGDSRGADGSISGTPYVGEDHLANTFGYELTVRPNGHFSVMNQRHASTPYVQVTSGITGSFGKGDGKVTGIDDTAFASRSDHSNREEAERSITGEGATTGQKITGDDWDRNSIVTGTEGASSQGRNMTLLGYEPKPIFTAGRVGQSKRENAVSKVTGSSGNTSDGALVTYSGGARG